MPSQAHLAAENASAHLQMLKGVVAPYDFGRPSAKTHGLRLTLAAGFAQATRIRKAFREFSPGTAATTSAEHAGSVRG
jgi:hypothetical protein